MAHPEQIQADVTLADLDKGREGRLGPILRQIEAQWVGDNPERYKSVRCGTLTVRNVRNGGVVGDIQVGDETLKGGHAEVNLTLRFPLDTFSLWEEWVKQIEARGGFPLPSPVHLVRDEDTMNHCRKIAVPREGEETDAE